MYALNGELFLVEFASNDSSTIDPTIFTSGTAARLNCYRILPYLCGNERSFNCFYSLFLADVPVKYVKYDIWLF